MAPQVRQAIAGHREHRDELGSEDEPDQPVDDGEPCSTLGGF
jgi:hypothetical protein